MVWHLPERLSNPKYTHKISCHRAPKIFRSQFLTRVEDIEAHLASIKEIEKIIRESSKQQNESCALDRVKHKYRVILSKNKIISKTVYEDFVKNSNDQAVLLDGILDQFKAGFTRYQENSFLLDFLKGVNPESPKYFEVSYILLSHLLSSLYPRNEELEDVFSKLVDKDIRKWLPSFSVKVEDQFSLGLKTLRTEYASLLKPLPQPFTYPAAEIIDRPVDKVVGLVVKELIDTESKFSECLQVVENKFGWSELSKQCKIFKAELEKDLLFAFSIEIIDPYFNEFLKAIQSFNKINISIKHETDHAIGNLHYADILLMPVQRPPRYVLLLKEIVKNLEEGPYKQALIERLHYLEAWIEVINIWV